MKRFGIIILIIGVVVVFFFFKKKDRPIPVAVAPAPVAVVEVIEEPVVVPVEVEEPVLLDGAANMQLLFSKELTPYSVIYEVKKGDNLTRIAKKFGTTTELIARSNHLTNDLIYPKDRLKVIVGKFSIFVDKSDNILILKLDGNFFKKYNVATGIENSTPTGVFIVTDKLLNPTWYKAGAVVEPNSPDNILGTRWIGISQAGYGIHGTTMPESIGQQVTAGCVRMNNREVEELYAIVPVGTSVEIID